MSIMPKILKTIAASDLSFVKMSLGLREIIWSMEATASLGAEPPEKSVLQTIGRKSTATALSARSTNGRMCWLVKWRRGPWDDAQVEALARHGGLRLGAAGPRERLVGVVPMAAVGVARVVAPHVAVLACGGQKRIGG